MSYTTKGRISLFISHRIASLNFNQEHFLIFYPLVLHFFCRRCLFLLSLSKMISSLAVEDKDKQVLKESKAFKCENSIAKRILKNGLVHGTIPLTFVEMSPKEEYPLHQEFEDANYKKWSGQLPALRK
jgi:hypothetical protein